MKNGRQWGQDVTLWPGWKKLEHSARNAVCAPEFLIPLTAALVLQIDDMDGRLSYWASTKTPVFGSVNAADEASNYFRRATRLAYMTTLILTPSGNDPICWTVDKLKGFAVGTIAITANNYSTDYLKDISKRMRPNGNDDRSFPSGTTSNAAVHATLAARNIDALPIDNGSRLGLKAGFYSLAALTAWSRVEADMHYPSDVLVGFALGYLMGAFFNDAFMGTENSEVTLTIEPSSTEGAQLKLSIFF